MMDMDSTSPAVIAALSESSSEDDGLVSGTERGEFFEDHPTGEQKQRGGRLIIKIFLASIGGIVLLVVLAFIWGFFVNVTTPQNRPKSETDTEESSKPDRITQLQEENAELRGANGELRARRALGDTHNGSASLSQTNTDTQISQQSSSAHEPDPPEQNIPVSQTPVPIHHTPAPPPPRPAPRTAPSRQLTHTSPPPDPETTWSELQARSIQASTALFEGTAPPVNDLRLSRTNDPPPVTSTAPSPEEIAIAARLPLDTLQPEAPVVPETIVPSGTLIAATQILPGSWNTADNRSLGAAAVRLGEPLVANDGQTVLPTDTLLLTEVQGVAANGWVTQYAIAARFPNADGRIQEVPLPAGAVSIRGKDGSPLIASEIQDFDGEIAKSRRSLALLGAAAGIGEELTRPLSSSSTFGPGFSSVTVDNGDRNLWGAALSGGGEALLDTFQTSFQDRDRDLRRRDSIFVVTADTPVTIAIEQPLSLPVLNPGTATAHLTGRE